MFLKICLIYTPLVFSVILFILLNFRLIKCDKWIGKGGGLHENMKSENVFRKMKIRV